MPSSEVKGLVLMGGKSSRMGTDKAFVEWEGKTLLQQAIDRLHEVTPDIYLSVNQRQYDLFNEEHQCISDKYIDKGPLGGILSALEHLQTDIIVLAVDMPALSVEPLQNLLNRGSATGSLIAHRDNSGFWQPLPSYWPQKSIIILKQAISENDYSLNQLLQIHGQSIKTPLDKSAFLNMNRPEDLQ